MNDNKMSNKASGLVPVSALSLAIAAASFGANCTASTEQETEYLLEEIIVSAQKRDQSLMDVGISVSVLDEQAIRDHRVEKVTDIVLFSGNTAIKENQPGLMPVITIRGVGLNDFNAINNPSAGVYIDEVSLSSLALMSTEIIDLSSVEVLKGPQGTLYGRNSTAGALNFRTAAPDLDSFSAQLDAGVGSYDTTETQGMINAPVGDNFGVRLAVKNVSQEEGFWENRATDSNVGERDELTVRLQGLWLSPYDSSSALLKLEKQKINSELGFSEFFGSLPTSSFSDCPGSPHCADFTGYTDTDNDPYKGDWSANPNYNVNQTAATLRLETDLGFADLASITGYIEFDRENSMDVDGGPLPLTDFRNTDEVRQFSQEFRLSNDNDSMVWQLGAFYANDQVKTDYNGDVGMLNTTTLSRADQDTTSMALFANIDWFVGDDVTIITGLRYSDEKKANVGFTQDLATEVGGSYLTMAPMGSAPITVAAVDEEINSNNVSWKLGVNWKPSDATLLYASATEGHKSGGFFAGIATDSLQLAPYEEETLRSYEVGLKSQLPQFGLSYELNAFYYDYQDVQTFIRDDSGALPIQRLSNIDSADIYGLDAVARYKPAVAEGLSISAGLGLLQTELSSPSGSTNSAFDGNDLPDSPKRTLQLGFTYDAQLSQGLEAEFSLNGRYQSASYRDSLNDPLLAQESYWVLNGRASLYLVDDLNVSLWCKNLADKTYVSHGLNQTSTLGFGVRNYGAPRTYGLSVTKQFN